MKILEILRIMIVYHFKHALIHSYLNDVFCEGVPISAKTKENIVVLEVDSHVTSTNINRVF